MVLPEWLRFTGGLYLILFAAIVVALLIACPQGIMGLLERGWTAIRRRPAGRNLPVKESAL